MRFQQLQQQQRARFGNGTIFQLHSNIVSTDKSFTPRREERAMHNNASSLLSRLFRCLDFVDEGQ